MYIDIDKPDTFFVLIDFIVWGKNAIIVQNPDI
jgi:hypothetical protein